ncbi:MAG TPA: hydroxymethylpyrimidine/phosphomethylpyrimidine kinase [Myxococcales bacterium]|nr:hydroxymethylpyrimidine/phosphomethylpyrimidine kinase [Myxococcales bacterium]
MAERPAVLCIGGLDPSGGAGLLADAEAVWAAGGRPLCAATAITIQSHKGVRGFELLKPQLVVSQVAVLLDDEKPAAVKLGMLGDSAIAFALGAVLGHRVKAPIVVDPVLRSTSGAALFAGAARRGYEPLLELGPVLTPNVIEAEKLTGAPVVTGKAEMEATAARVLALGCRAVVLKGGHLEAKTSPDYVLDAKKGHWLDAKRLPGSARGSGCRFASALATKLALGESLLEAARYAKAYVRKGFAAD